MSRLRWYYGPRPDYPDPGRMWHVGCDGEVMYIDDGYFCTKCNEQDDDERSEDS